MRNIKFLQLFLLSAGIAFSPVTFAAEMPCVKEVCLGDGLDKLRGIKFKPVNSARAEKLSARKRADRAELFGFQGGEAPAYVLLGEFDENVLSDMGNIKTACRYSNVLEGAYVSESGHKTNVQVSIWPDKSGNMKWVVKGISRAYKGLQSRGESEQLIQDLREKYAQWDAAKNGQPKPGNAGMMLIPLREPVLSLMLAPTAEMIQAEIYKNNPLCKPAKKVNLD